MACCVHAGMMQVHVVFCFHAFHHGGILKAPFRPCACAFECTLERLPLLLLCIEFYHYYNTSTTLRLCWCPAKNRGTPSVHLLQGKWRENQMPCACENCPTGYYGSTTGLTTSTCTNAAPAGYYAPAGSTSASLCSAGHFGSEHVISF